MDEGPPILTAEDVRGCQNGTGSSSSVTLVCHTDRSRVRSNPEISKISPIPPSIVVMALPVHRSMSGVFSRGQVARPRPRGATWSFTRLTRKGGTSNADRKGEALELALRESILAGRERMLVGRGVGLGREHRTDDSGFRDLRRHWYHDAKPQLQARCLQQPAGQHAQRRGGWRSGLAAVVQLQRLAGPFQFLRRRLLGHWSSDEYWADLRHPRRALFRSRRDRNERWRWNDGQAGDKG